MSEWQRDTRVRAKVCIRKEDIGVVTKVDDQFVYIEWEGGATSHVSRSLVDDVLEKVGSVGE